MSYWFNSNKSTGIVVSSRIRLARNINGIPFPSKMTDATFKKINALVRDAITKSDNEIAKKLKYIEMNNVPEIERFAMVERHIISKTFALNYKNRAIIISEDESICIMLGEEDHIRIQVLTAGLDLHEAYQTANAIDDILCSNLDIAYDDKMGFLTACPTNLGTGLRASVMLHLPLVEGNNEIPSFIDTVSKVGFTVRGMYGEGTKALASLYQLSNQITLGISEKSAIDSIIAVANRIMDKENNYRKQLNKLKFEDRCMRSYGVLKNARILSSSELLSRLSDIQLGIAINVINCNISPIELLVKAQPYMIMKQLGEMSPDSRDIERANMVRNLL